MNYYQLLSVNLFHRYFSSGKGEPFRFEPTPDCEKRLRRFSQLMRMSGYGFRVLKDLDKIQEPLTDEDYFFDIAIFPTDPYFSIFSDLEIDYKSGQVYYLGNTGEPGSLESTSIPLTLVERGSGDPGQVFAGVPVRLQPKKFPVTVDASSGDTVRLLDKKNKTVKEWSIEEKGGNVSLYADVSREPGGVFLVEKNGAIVSRCYADDHCFKTKPPIILGIGLSLNDVKVNDNYSLREYEIRVGNRSAYWQYRVFARSSQRKLESLQIENKNQKLLPGVTFSSVSMDQEKREVVFLSDKPIPMFEYPYMDI